jgi:tetratricopeptide (TPR) repeat protein
MPERRSERVAEAQDTSAPEASGPIVSGFDPGPRPVRRSRPRPDAMQPVQMQIWLFTGVAVVLGIVYFAAQGFWHSNAVPVAGAQPEQQQRADLARAALERDSTNLAARIDLANLLYDTGNWSEAIIHYRSAERQDPTRATTIVDLGVCYYNLSQFAAAESLFQRALVLDPHQVFALFNLGIVAESQQKWDEAMDYFHRAMRAGPPEPMKAPLEEHLKAVMAKTGKVPPPLTN